MVVMTVARHALGASKQAEGGQRADADVCARCVDDRGDGAQGENIETSSSGWRILSFECVRLRCASVGITSVSQLRRLFVVVVLLGLANFDSFSLCSFSLSIFVSVPPPPN